MIFTRRGLFVAELLAQKPENKINLRLCRLEHGRNQNAVKNEPAARHYLQRRRQSGERCRLDFNFLCSRLLLAFSLPFTGKRHVKEQLAAELEPGFEFRHSQTSCLLRIKNKAYEETAAALNVPQPGIFSHAEQLLNGEAAAC